MRVPCRHIIFTVFYIQMAGVYLDGIQSAPSIFSTRFSYKCVFVLISSIIIRHVGNDHTHENETGGNTHKKQQHLDSHSLYLFAWFLTITFYILLFGCLFILLLTSRLFIRNESIFWRRWRKDISHFIDLLWFLFINGLDFSVNILIFRCILSVCIRVCFLLSIGNGFRVETSCCCVGRVKKVTARAGADQRRTNSLE